LCPSVDKVQQQFDEYESLLATCLHYSLRVGVKGSLESISKFLDTTRSHIHNFQTGFSSPECRDYIDFCPVVQYPTNMPKLSGHKSVVTSPTTVLTFGGCGENSVRMKHLIQTTFNPEPDTSSRKEPDLFSRILLENPNYYERMHGGGVFIPPQKGAKK